MHYQVIKGVSNHLPTTYGTIKRLLKLHIGRKMTEKKLFEIVRTSNNLCPIVRCSNNFKTSNNRKAFSELTYIIYVSSEKDRIIFLKYIMHQSIIHDFRKYQNCKSVLSFSSTEYI